MTVTCGGVSQWCETQSACNRLRLVDILVKPMQRLTKYSLLLKAIHKKTDCEDQRLGLEIMVCLNKTLRVNINTKNVLDDSILLRVNLVV